MTDQPPPDRRREPEPPIDESSFGGSAAETGGDDEHEGATIANSAGDPMSITENEEPRRPEGHSREGAKT